MGRTVAVIWHASFSLAAGVLYFFFVLPRTPELMGQTSPTLGTAMRIVTGALIGLAALPVVFTLLRTRKPEFGTPALALKLRGGAQMHGTSFCFTCPLYMAESAASCVECLPDLIRGAETMTTCSDPDRDRGLIRRNVSARRPWP